jgi:hypothetical protein
MRKQWIEFCGRGQRWIPGASSNLCSLHFSPSGRVKARAVPQLLSPKSSLKRCGVEKILQMQTKHYSRYSIDFSLLF